MPECIEATESMERLLDLWPILVTVIPGILRTGFLFNCHVMLIGASPFVTIHCNPTVSPALAGSSPKVNGCIWEITIKDSNAISTKRKDKNRTLNCNATKKS